MSIWLIGFEEISLIQLGGKLCPMSHFLIYLTYTTAIDFWIENSSCSGFLPLVGSVANTMFPFEDCSWGRSYCICAQWFMVAIRCYIFCLAGIMGLFNHNLSIRLCSFQFGLQLASNTLWKVWEAFREGSRCLSIHRGTHSSKPSSFQN